MKKLKGIGCICLSVLFTFGIALLAPFTDGGSLIAAVATFWCVVFAITFTVLGCCILVD